MKKGRVSVVILLTMVFAVVILPAASGEEVTWIGEPGVKGRWYDETNWSNKEVPDYANKGNSVSISNGGIVVLESDDASADVLFIGKGVSSSGTLNISNNGTLKTNDKVSVGFGDDSKGAISVSGAGSTLTAGTAIYVGKDGIGTATVSDGGLITSTSMVVSELSTLNVETGGTVTTDKLWIETGGRANVTGNLRVSEYVSNNGTITGTTLRGPALKMLDGSMVINGAGGTISDGDAISSEGSLSVDNRGAITATTYAIYAGKQANIENSGRIHGDFRAITIGGGRIINSGTISSATSSDSIAAEGDLTVENSGTLIGSVTSFGNAVIINSGTISGATRDGLYIGGRGYVKNSGTITGARRGIWFGDGGATLDNWGSITGTGGTAVLMGSGDDQAMLRAGSVINGNVDGGGGTDSILFENEGQITNGTALNFETLTKSGDGTWTIGGDLSSGKELHLEGGVLRVKGQYTQEKGSKLHVAFTNGETGLISADTAQLNGGSLAIANGYIRKGRHTLIETDNGLTGTFEGLVPGGENYINRYLKYMIGYDGSSAFIYVGRSRLFADDALTGNETAVGGYLDSIYSNVSGDMITVFEEMMDLPADGNDIRLAFNQMGGASHTAFAAIDTYRTGAFYRGLFGGSPPAAAGGAVSGQGPVRLAANMNVLADADNTYAARDVKKGPFNLWVKGYGVTGSSSGIDIASCYDYTIGGTMAGAELSFVPSARAGFAMGYAHTKMDMSGLKDEGSEDSVQGALYVSWNNPDGRWYTDLALAYSRNSYETTRYIDFGGIQRQARASYNGYDISGYLEGGYRLFVNTGAFNITPYASLLALKNHRDGFTETGADPLNLDVGAASTTSLQGAFGARLAREFMMDKDSGFSLTPQISGRWIHEFGDNTSSIDARFAGAPSGSFTVSSDAQDRDGGVLSLGITGRVKDSLSLFFVYDGLVRSKETAHALTGGVKFSW